MFKCKICGKKFTEITALYNHIENKHKEMIPKDMTVQQYYYYMKTGKMNGNCVMCKQPTGWNQNTGKYNRFCGNPKCKEEYVKIMKGRMVAKYGKTHLLNDPDKQREMLANRSISGTYTWSDGKHESTYTGSYELDFLKTLDGFFDWDPEDISMPSPHTYTYKYEGEDKFYIPDVFIHSLDLEIEIKDGGDNPNNHHKIQDVDKEKERLKDEVMCSQKVVHYIKITNKNYENFFRFLKEIKKEFEKYGDEKKIPRIFKIEDIKGTNTKPIKESYDIIEEGVISKIKDKLMKIKDPMYISYDELKRNVDEAKKKYQEATKNGTFDLTEPNQVYQFTSIIEDEKFRIMKLVDHIHAKGNKDVDGEKKIAILGQYHDWLDQFEVKILQDMKKMLKQDIADSKTKLTKSFNNCKTEAEYKEFVVAVTYMISYYRKLGNLVNMPEINTHCKWLESIHKKACDKANIGDGPLVLESNSDMWDDINAGIVKFEKFTNVEYKKRDAFLSLKYDLVKNDPKELQEYLSKLIKAARFEADIWYVQQMAKRADEHYRKRLRKHPEMKDVYGIYYDWLKSGGIDKEIKARRKDGIKLIENYEFVDEAYIRNKKDLYVNFELFESGQSNICLVTGLSGSGKSTLSDELCKKYKATSIELDVFEHPDMEVGPYSTKNVYDNYFNTRKDLKNNLNQNTLNNDELATEMTNALLYAIDYCNKHPKEKFIIEGLQIFADIDPEYVKGLPIVFVNTSMISSMVRKCKRDKYRYQVADLFEWYIADEKKFNGFKKEIIEEKFEPDKYGIHESYIIDTMKESSISIPQMSYYLQNQYEEDMRDYLNTYKKYYNLMLKEQPAAVKHINEDIKQCLIVIDGLAAKGVENNLVQFAKDDLGEIVKAAKHGKPVKVYEATGFKIPTNGNLWISTDWHFYKNKDNTKFKINPNIDKILNNYKKCVKSNDTFIFLGDLYDARTIFDMKLVPKIFDIKKLKGYKIMIKGNHDVNTTQFYLDLGFDEVYEKTYNIGNIVFSHEPVEVNDNEINIHGHIHFSETYWGMEPLNHLDAYIEHYNFNPVKINDIIDEYRGTHRISNKALERFDNNVIHESINNKIIDCKLVYNNPNSNQLFSLRDKDSKLIIENSYVIQRDKIGTSCSVTPYYKDIKEENILEFQLIINEGVNLSDLNNKVTSGIIISSLYNINDKQNIFIREACMRLFGKYPDEIKFK